MKRLLTLIAAAGLLLLPSVAIAQTQTGGAEPPPISQALVREGDFALDLAVALKLGEPATEAEAVDILVSAGITPKNGWLGDYPVTPDILAELEESVVTAAVSGNIPLAKEDAYTAFRELVQDYGLPVRPAEGEEYAEGGELEYGDYSSERVADGEDYYEPTVIREYYYVNEPPVITYYTPPWDYYYLYAWVPYPFWWYGFYYPGYFILHDFTVVVHHHHKHHRWHGGKDWSGDTAGKRLVSNHVKDSATGEVARLDPASRKAIRAERRAERREQRSLNRQRAASSFSDVKAAESIVSRETSRAEGRAERRAARAESRADGQAVRTERRAERQAVRAGRGAERQADRQGRAAIKAERRAARDTVRAERRATRNIERATRLGDRSNDRANRSGRSMERATRLGDRSSRGGGDRSFSRPSRGGGDRSFSRPSRGGGDRSFSRSSRGGGRSFGRSHGGGGFRGGGGCRGRNC